MFITVDQSVPLNEERQSFTDKANVFTEVQRDESEFCPL